MAFRDDRDALLARNEALQTDLQRAQAELASRPVQQMPAQIHTVHVLERGEAFILATAVLCAFWHPAFFVLVGLLLVRQRSKRMEIEKRLRELEEENRYLSDIITNHRPMPPQ